jgi:hypothetical protein
VNELEVEKLNKQSSMKKIQSMLQKYLTDLDDKVRR